jgi:hypothetical protein
LRASGRFIVRVKIPSLKDVKRCSWALGSIFKDIGLHPLVKIVDIALTNLVYRLLLFIWSCRKRKSTHFK